MDTPRPQVIHLADVPVTPAEDAVTKVRIARIVTKERCGSNLLLGAAWMDPGESSNLWSSEPEEAQGDEPEHFYGPVDETYYVIRGQMRLHWNEGVLELGPDDAVYLAPGWQYRLECVGDEPAFFVYGMTPTPQ